MVRVRLWLVALGLLSAVEAADILSSSGFQVCGNGTQDITVSQFELSFDRSTNELVFAVAGNSQKSQNVTATINVTALGQVRYTNSFNPCDYNIAQLCPIPSGPFHADGNITIPSQYVSQIPSIAFTIPDLDGFATLELLGNNGVPISCLTSQISNGKSASQTSVTLATVGIAGAALVMTGIASIGSLGAAGGTSAGPNSGSAHSPNFGDIIQWFQFVAFSGMYSVNYPPVYRSFCENFAWSTGLVQWAALQESIDNFRAATGGNLTDMSYQYLQNATLVYTGEPSQSLQKRAIDVGLGDSPTPSIVNGTEGGAAHVVSGIEAFAEKLLIPSANTFMTVLVIFMIILAGIAVIMLAAKLILELWARCGHLSKRWEAIRQDYWRILSTTIVRIILIVYGTWALYCLWQFHAGDSWAAALLAAVTLALFTGIIIFFTIRIFYLASKARKLEGGVDELYEHQPWMRKYGFFYDQFKSRLWWFFVPIIIMSLVRAVFIVFAGGNGMVQAIGILAAEGLFLVLLFWRRPYDGRGANVINAMIAVVRVMSIVCILVFVEELGISRTTQTVLGVVLIALQSTLTIVLAILLAIGAIASCLHKRKPAQRSPNDLDDDLQPLGIPSGGDVSELGRYPTKGGYVATATSDQPYPPEYMHRASTVYRDPFVNNPGSVYEEYSSSYGSSRTPTIASRKVSVGHGRVGSIGHESQFHYSPVGSPPPVIGGGRVR